MHSITSQALKWSLIGITLVFVVLVSVSAFAQGKKSEKYVAGWEPENIQEVLQPGQSLEIPLTYVPDENISDVSVVVSPEISAYVSVVPETIGKLKKGKPISLTATVNVPITALPELHSGLIQLIEEKENRKLPEFFSKWEQVWRFPNSNFKKPMHGMVLPVSIQIAWPESHHGSISFEYPPNLQVIERDGDIVVGPVSDAGLPALFAIMEVILTDDLSSLPVQESLSIIARRSLEPEDIVSMSYHNGGLEVNANTFTRHHFYIYNPATNTALEFIAGQDDFFTSPEFESILQSLIF
jgi:hypothetical protein